MDELRVALRYAAAGVHAQQQHAAPAPHADVPGAGSPGAHEGARYVGVVDVECAYSQRHWAAAFARRPWWAVCTAAEWAAGGGGGGSRPAVPPLQIREYEPLHWDDVLAGAVTTNNFMVRKGLCRKANFAAQMQRHVLKCGAGCPLARGLPETAVIDTVPALHGRPAWLDLGAAMADALSDADDLIERTRRDAGAALWILKPSLANKGAEIHLVRGADEVEAAVRAWRDVGQWVLQEYVARPLLLAGGRKFHLRVYALADGALDVHVFGEALVLCAVEPYGPAAGDPTARHAHITNTCVGAEHGGFLEAAHVRTLSELPALLVEAGACASDADAARRVGALVAGVHASVAHVFDSFFGGMHGYQALPSAFELYGLDFLVDEAWRLLLLEANPTPDIRQSGSRLDPVIADLLEGAVRIGVDGRFPPPAGAAPPPPLRHGWARVYSRAWPKR